MTPACQSCQTTREERMSSAERFVATSFVFVELCLLGRQRRKKSRPPRLPRVPVRQVDRRETVFMWRAARNSVSVGTSALHAPLEVSTDFEPFLNFGFLALPQETRVGRAPHSLRCVPLARALHVTCRGLLRLRGAYRPYHRPWATRRFIYGSDMDNGECMGESKYGRCPCSTTGASCSC